MFDWVRELTAFAVFLVIGGVGFIFLVISLVFGELFEHFEGADFDHDIDHGGPGFFSVRGMAVFVTAFGATGALGIRYGLSPLAASAAGFGGGVVFAYAIYLFARFLYGQQATSEIHTQELVGQSARVVVAIPAGGVGQVRCRVGEEIFDKVARAQGDEAIPENATVRVEEVLGEIVIVRRQ
jgi:membrane protein implicated in regulation of membrane protease activity